MRDYKASERSERSWRDAPGLTVSTSSFLLASPMLRRAMSTSFWPGRQFTQLFREWDTALAT